MAKSVEVKILGYSKKNTSVNSVVDYREKCRRLPLKVSSI